MISEEDGETIKRVTTEVCSLLHENHLTEDLVARILGCTAAIVSYNSDEKSVFAATLIGTYTGVLTGELLNLGSDAPDN